MYGSKSICKIQEFKFNFIGHLLILCCHYLRSDLEEKREIHTQSIFYLTKFATKHLNEDGRKNLIDMLHDTVVY